MKELVWMTPYTTTWADPVFLLIKRWAGEVSVVHSGKIIISNPLAGGQGSPLWLGKIHYLKLFSKPAGN